MKLEASFGGTGELSPCQIADLPVLNYLFVLNYNKMCSYFQWLHYIKIMIDSVILIDCLFHYNYSIDLFSGYLNVYL